MFTAKFKKPNEELAKDAWMTYGQADNDVLYYEDSRTPVDFRAKEKSKR